MKKQRAAPPDDPAAPEGPAGDGAERRMSAVVRGVMAALGRPPAFLRATARAVGGDGFRVNVLTGDDPASARIAHSYFVTADAAGGVTASAPPLRKCY